MKRDEQKHRADSNLNPRSDSNGESVGCTSGTLSIETYLEHYFQDSPNATALLDTEEHILRINHGFSKLFGYSENEVIGRHIDDIVVPEELKADADRVSQKVRSNGYFNYDTERCSKDGNRIQVSLRSSAVHLDEEKIGYYLTYSDISERKDIEDTIKESEAKFRNIVEASPMGMHIYELRSDGRLVFSGANPAADRMLGVDNSTFIGQTIEEAFPPLADTEIPERYRQAAAEGRSWWTEQITYQDNQVSGAFEVHCFQTSPGKMVAMFLEITERKRTEEALRESEDRYRALVEDLVDVVMGISIGGRLEYCSPAVKEFGGYDPDEEIGKHIARYFARRRELIKGLKLIKRAVIDRKPASFEFLYRPKHREPFYVEVTGKPIIKDDRIVTIQCVMRDITERRQAEQALRDSEERYRKVFEAAPEAIVIFNIENGRYVDVNQSFFRLSGFTRKEVLGKTLPELNQLFNPADREEYLTFLKRDGQIDDYEIRFRAKNGAIKDLVLSARPIRYKGQDCLAVLAKDITPLKKAEQDKAQLQIQLQQAQKMEAVGTLAGGIAHDFNNILQVISGYVEVLANAECQNPDNTRILNQVDGAVSRASDLVRQLLTFSRKVEPKLNPVDLNNEVVSAAKLLERTIPKMVTVETRLTHDLKLIEGDSSQLSQILLNLGSNAADAMPKGGKLIFETKNVLVTKESNREYLGLKSGNYTQLSVTDTGQGMDPETIKHIFDPFYTTKDIGKGTGLGLATAYGIVQSHRGYITCHSQPGVGTSFKILLPALMSGDVIDESGTDSPGNSLVGRETILLVDDEESLREVGFQFLENHGYKVLTADSGENALETYRDVGPDIDLVILDLGMPGMGGKQCLEELLAIDPQAKVIIASGYSAIGTDKDFIDMGAKGFVGKPFRLSEMAQTVRSILDQSESTK